MHNRKLNRLPGYDYSMTGYYFVTICTKGRREYFGTIENKTINLNEFGVIVTRQWEWLEEQYPYVELDQYVIMPDHIHGIIHIVGNGRDRSLQKIKSLSELIVPLKPHHQN